MKTHPAAVLVASLVTGCGGAEEVGPEPDVLASELRDLAGYDVDQDGVTIGNREGIYRLADTGDALELVEEAEDVCAIESVDGVVFASLANRLRRVGPADGFFANFNQGGTPTGCIALAEGSGSIFLGYRGFDRSIVASAEPEAFRLASDATRSVLNEVVLVTGDTEAIYFIDEPSGSSVAQLYRSPRDGTDVVALTEVGLNPTGLAIDANSVYWGEAGIAGTLTLFAVDKSNGLKRTVAFEPRGCGFYDSLALADGYLYFPSSVAEEEGCGGDNFFSVSRVRVEGGDIEDVLAKPGMGPYRNLRVFDGRLYMIAEEAPPRFGDAILSVPVP
ncbi:MAG: hypothetical protein AAF715_12535 [Myxococcota bacterium]